MTTVASVVYIKVNNHKKFFVEKELQVKKTYTLVIVLIILMIMVSPIAVFAVKAYSGIPTFSIVSVEQDKTVTIKANNFPAGETFTVTMGAFGTLGIGGVIVQKTDSGSGGTFTVSYSIPASLAGSYRIAIRLQSSSSGYYAYNWFYNNASELLTLRLQYLDIQVTHGSRLSLW